MSRGLYRTDPERRWARTYAALSVIAGISVLILLTGTLDVQQQQPKPEPERAVLAFHTFIGLSWNSSATMIEKVIARSDGSNFQKGLHRRLPHISSDDFGSRSFSYSSQAFTFDGNPLTLPAPVEEPDAMHFVLGKAEAAPADGEHTYEWTYSIANLVGTLNKSSGFSWDVTEGWDMPIHSLNVLLRLPPLLPPDAIISRGEVLRKTETGFVVESVVAGSLEADPERPKEKLQRFQLPLLQPLHKFRVTVSWPPVDLRPLS